jgi:hypothetical protein
MSTKPKKKTALKMVRRMVPADAYIWRPGVEIPEPLQRVIDDQITIWIKEQDERFDKFRSGYRPPPPMKLSDIVNALIYNISGVDKQTGIQAVGLFIERMKELTEQLVDSNRRAYERTSKALDDSHEWRRTLDKILDGSLRITAPSDFHALRSGTFETRNIQNSKVENGEAVTDQRPAH